MGLAWAGFLAWLRAWPAGSQSRLSSIARLEGWTTTLWGGKDGSARYGELPSAHASGVILVWSLPPRSPSCLRWDKSLRILAAFGRRWTTRRPAGRGSRDATLGRSSCERLATLRRRFSAALWCSMLITRGRLRFA